VALVRN